MTNWTPREEKLPPPHEDFIALNSDGRIFRSRMCYGMHEPWFTYPAGDSSPSDTAPDWIDVTHWIPMPDIPKCPPHDFRNRGDGTAFCHDCGERVDVTETGAAK